MRFKLSKFTKDDERSFEPTALERRSYRVSDHIAWMTNGNIQ